MKQSLVTGYSFSPSARTLDFSALPGFDARRLFAAINLRANAVIYGAGLPGLGYTGLSGSVLTLACDTTAMSASDPLCVIYDDGSAPLPPGAATSALQAAGNATLSNLSTGLGAPADAASATSGVGGSVIALLKALRDKLLSGTILVDGSARTQPISHAALVADAAIPAGSPFSSAAAGAFATFDVTGAASVDLYVTALAGSAIQLWEQASDGSNAWSIVPLTFIANAIGNQQRVFNNAFGVGLWRASVGGKTLQLRNAGAPGGTNTVAVVLKTQAWAPPSTYVEGGSLVANSSTVTADTSGTIAAGANVAAAAGNVGRQIAIISNTGTNPMTVRFGAAATAAVGHIIAPGTNLFFDAKCPTGAINLFSAGGTTYAITTG